METLNPIMIIGCGDIGRRIAALYQQRGMPVSGVARGSTSLGKMRTQGIIEYIADLDQPDTLRGLPTAHAKIFYLAPPPASGTTDVRIQTFLNLLTAADLPEKIIYLSTSGVYGDTKGAWVTENSPVSPRQDRSRRRLAAEQVLQDFQHRAGVPVVILRVGGIYGPGRLPLERIKSKEPVLRLSECGYTNRIHADDLAAICIAAADNGEGIYNVSDGNPSTMTEYFFQIADHFNLARPPEISFTEARRRLSKEMLSYLEESRRLDSSRMLRELGIALKYPTLEDGLAACVMSAEI